MSLILKYLREWEEYLFLKKTHCLIVIIGNTGKILECNEAIRGLTERNEPPADFELLLVSGSRNRFSQAVEEVLKSGAPQSIILDFGPEEKIDPPDSRECRFLPLEDDKILIFAEPRASIDQKTDGEYLKLRNELEQKTRELEKTRHELCHEKKRLKRSLEKIERMARIDPLTRISNRRNIMEILRSEITRAWRYHNDLCVMIIDMDHFKKINDTCGHPAGDEVLKKCSHIIIENLRESDSVGRLAGEQFLAVMPETSPDSCYKTANRLRSLIGESSFNIDNTMEIKVTASLGISHFRPEEDTIETLLSRADKAMQKAKEKGRNRVCILNDE